MRRSGVEWLGRWTATDGASETDPKNRAWLRSQVSLVPALSRAVREMPDEDSQQAARLLGTMGLTARDAIPAMCEALVKHGSMDVFKRYYFLNSLVHCAAARVALPRYLCLCSKTRNQKCDAPPLVPPACATTLGSTTSAQCLTRLTCFLLLRVRSRTSGFERVSCPRSKVRRRSGHGCAAGGTPVFGSTDLQPGGRLLAHLPESVRHSLAEDFQVPVAKHTATARAGTASPDAGVRLAALRVLAYMPGDVSPLASSLRSELRDGKEQTYALAALCHAAGTNRTLVADVFLSDLSSPDLAKRRQAAADVRLVTMPLWADGFFPDKEPLPWYSDDRLAQVTAILP